MKIFNLIMIFIRKLTQGVSLSVVQVHDNVKLLIKHEKDIKDELRSLTNKDLKAMLVDVARYDNSLNTKSKMVNKIYTDALIMVSSRLKIRCPIILISDVSIEQQYKNHLLAGVERLTLKELKSTLSSNAENYKIQLEQIQINKQKIKKDLEALEKPISLQDYEIKKSLAGLNKEEQRKYEDLKTTDLLKNYIPHENNKIALVAYESVKELQRSDLVKSINTMNKNTIFKFSLNERIELDAWRLILDEVKKLGGASYKGCFYFTTDCEEEAQRRLTKLKDKLIYKTIIVKNSTKLRKIADRLQGAQRLQRILRLLADKQDRDELKFLNNVSNEIQVQMLDILVKVAVNRQVDFNASEKSMDAHDFRNKYYTQPVTIEAIDYIQFNEIPKQPVISCLEQGINVKGYIKESKALLNRINKIESNNILANHRLIKHLNKMKQARILDSEWFRSYSIKIKHLKEIGVESVEQLRATLREYLQFYSIK